VGDLTKRFGNLRAGSSDIFAHGWFAEVDWDKLYRREIPAPYVPKIEGEGDASQYVLPLTLLTPGSIDTKKRMYQNMVRLGLDHTIISLQTFDMQLFQEGWRRVYKLQAAEFDC